VKNSATQCNVTNRNKPYRDATQAFSVAAKKLRNASAVATFRKLPQANRNKFYFFRSPQDDSQSEQPTAMT